MLTREVRRQTEIEVSFNASKDFFSGKRMQKSAKRDMLIVWN